MSDNPINITAEIVEKNIVTADIVEKNIIDVNIKTIDILPRKAYLTELSDVSQQIPYAERQVWVYSESEKVFVNKLLTELLEYYTKIETPIKIGLNKYQLNYSAIPGTLLIFLNGISETHITIISDKIFEFTGNIDDTDNIQVKYYRK